MAVAPATKSVKKTSVARKTKTSPSHPPYIQMITEALVALKERTGSSSRAIAKHIEEEQKVSGLPANYKKLLYNHLKKYVDSGKLVKVKNSFKLSPTAVKAAAPPADEEPKVKKTATKVTAKKETVKPKAKAKAKVLPVKAKATPVKAKAKALSVKAKAKAKTASVKSPVKKVVPMKAKKPKSVKSPVKKVAATKRARK